MQFHDGKGEKAEEGLLAREQKALDMSVDTTVPAEIRLIYAPEKTHGGWNRSFLLRPFSHEADPPVTTIYKPRLGVLGASDGRLLYKAAEHPYLFEVLQTSGGAVITLLNKSGQLPLAAAGFDMANPPKSFLWEGKLLERYLRPVKTIAPAEECLREALFSVLIDYLEEKALSFELGISSFGYPKTTIEALYHPDFGVHHTVGSHQQYITGAKPISRHFSFAPPKVHVAGPIYKISCEQCLKIGASRLIACDLDCRLSNMLIRKGDIIQIDAGMCFPHFRGLDVTAHAPHQWMYLPRGLHVPPDSWRSFAAALDPDELLDRFYSFLSGLCVRFPDEKFAFPPECAVVTYAGVLLVKYGLKLGIPINHLGAFQQRICRKDARGNPLRNKKGRLRYWPSSFWTAIELAMLDANCDLEKCVELPATLKESLNTYVARMISEVYRW